MPADRIKTGVPGPSFISVLFVLALTLTLLSPSVPSAQVTWSRTYGGSSYDSFSAVIPTSDGGFVGAGETYSFGLQQGGVWVVKMNSAGAVAWQNIYSSPSGTSVASSIIQTSDGGYAVVGLTYASGAGACDVWVLKLNAAGLIGWQKTYGGAGAESGFAISQTSDGGFIVAGDTDSFGAGNLDFMLLKLTASGAVLWQKAYGTSSNDESPSAVRQTSDGGYIVAGYSGMYGRQNAFANGPTDFWVMKLDSSGVITWQKYFGGSSEEFANDIIPTSDGGYIAAGYSSTFSGGYNYDCWVVKLDSYGAISWQKAFGGSGDDFANAVRQTSDGGFVVTGKSSSIGSGDGDFFVVRLDAAGGILWQKGYAGSGDDEAASIEQTSDGGFIVAGSSFSAAAYNGEAWVLRLNSSGGIDSSCSFIYDSSLSAISSTGAGTASAAAVSSSSATAANSAVSPSPSSATVILQCSGTCPTITLSPSALPGATAGQAYSQQITAAGGTAPYTYSALSSSLPPGIVLSTDGLLSGTPTQAGSYPIEIYAADYAGCTGTAAYTLTVGGSCATITLSPQSLPSALPGVYYIQAITASGGSSPYTYAVTAGGLPPGLSLDAGGTLSGTPTSTGSYDFTVTATDSVFCTGSASYSLSTGCTGTTGTLGGTIAVSRDGGEIFYPLDGPGISGTVVAEGPSGTRYTANLANGTFDFGSLPYGRYELAATINYTDHIPYDAKLLAEGCPSPSGGKVIKSVSSVPRILDVICDQANFTVLDFEGPMVMLHGMYGCYEKWYSGNQADPSFYSYWDNYAREQGVISFTPNYEWWGDNGSWISRAGDVAEQVRQDMAGLTSEGVLPYILVAHDMGGLVARVLASPVYKGDPVSEKVTSAYIIGTPNSGMDFNLRSGKNGLLGPNSIVRYFNDAYPDFGDMNVYAIAGNRGWWGTDNNDGMISLNSAFHLTRIACKNDDCIAYPALTLESGAGHVFDYRHRELGSPASVEEIFENVILLTGRSEGTRSYSRVPEAPVGGVGWGTVGHTTATMGTGGNSLRGEAVQDYPFTVSKCDGIAVFVTVTSGSGTFKAVDPSGSSHDFMDNTFVKTAPEPGTWNLRVTPGASGITFEAAAIDNSIFGIKAYITNRYVAVNEKTTVRADLEGDWSLATIGSVKALIYDSAGTLLQTLTLANNGSYFSNEFGAPASPGSYQVAVKAEGTFSGQPFSRVEFETLTVLPSSHLFTGAFADSPADLDGDGKYDAIEFSAAASVTQQEYYLVSADLFDSAGNFVSHSTAALSSSGQASLVFPLAGICCSQLSSPLAVTGLKLLNADTLAAADAWSSPIATHSYSSGQFECDSTAPAPTISRVVPGKAVAGTTTSIAVVGKNFDPAATVLFDAGIGQQITVLNTKPIENRVIYTTINVPQSAVGTCNVKVRNPDGKTGTLYEVFVISEDTPPSVRLEDLYDGAAVGGLFSVIANAADDVKVASVSFELDGVPQSTVTSFPFIWSWDTSSSAVGAHTVRAVATDSAGHQGYSLASVNVIQPPVVTAISKKGNPFRLVVLGSNLQREIAVFINDEQWTNVSWKSEGKIVIKGGSVLKQKVPRGTSTRFRFINDDGGEQTVVWQW